MENLNLIYKIVWSYTKSNPALDFDDLFSEACLVCLEALPAFDQTKGKKSTYIYHVVSNRLNSLVSNKRQCKEYCCPDYVIEYLLNYITPENDPSLGLLATEQWEMLWASLSPEAQVICEVLLKDDASLPIDKPKLCRGAISRLLRDDGWSWDNIWKTFAELKNTFSLPINI